MSLQRTSLALGLFAAALSLAACNKASDGASTAKGSENAADPNTADMPDFGGVEVVAVKVDGVGPTRNAAILDGLNLAVRQVNGVPLAGISINSQGSQRRSCREANRSAIDQASTIRPFCGNRPAGLICRNTTIRANTSTFAIDVVAKKVITALRPSGIAGHTNSKEPEPTT